MRRYEGLLRGTDAAPCQPRRWAVTAVTLMHGDAGDRPGLRVRRIASWDMIIMDFRGSKSVRVEALSGRSVGKFWEMLLRAGQGQLPLWTISPRALLCWQTLGLWDRLEAGQLALAGSNSYSADRSCGLPGSADGQVLLTADPPCAAILEDRDADTQIRWVCAGNYGLQPLAAGSDGGLEAREIASAVAECTLVMDRHRLGGWALTAGAIALRGWQSTYSGPPLYISSPRSGDPLERRASFGGRLFARPTGPEGVTAYAVDARSMYPYMSINYPQGVDLIQGGLTGNEAKTAVSQTPAQAIASVEIDCPEPALPAAATPGTAFRPGRYETVLAGPELELAVRAGWVGSVHAANIYRLAAPLADYQRRVWAARLDCASGDLQGAAPLIKRLGVSLIGKFFQRNELWQTVTPDICDPLWGRWVALDYGGGERHYRARAGQTEVSAGSELAAHAIPSLAIWVWSAARVRLWQWMRTAGMPEVYYTDTDGMIVSPLGYERLVDAGLIGAGDMGMLRRVAGPCHCVVHGLKHVEVGGRLVQAGLPMAARGGTSESGVPWYRAAWKEQTAPEWRGSWVEKSR